MRNLRRSRQAEPGVGRARPTQMPGTTADPAPDRRGSRLDRRLPFHRAGESKS